MPEVRKANGKPEEGKVILKAYHSGNHVFIEIEMMVQVLTGKKY